MAPKYTLYYFNARARAELVRLTLHQGGVDFEDKRIEFVDWPALKPKSPNGQLPFLEVDGVGYPESMCLARFVAKRCDLMGKTDIDNLKTDIVVAQCDSVRDDWIRFTFDKILTDAQKAELKKKFMDETFPTFLNNIEKQLTDNGTGFLIGNGVSLADLAVFDVVDTPLKAKPDMLDKHPRLKAVMASVKASPNVAKYLSTRPETEF